VRNPRRRTTQTWLALLGWVGLSLAAGAFGSLFEPGAWYASLRKPPWTPPDSAFPLVWTVLYGAMGVAAWFVWKGPAGSSRKTGLILFLIQLALNAAWSWIFFGLHLIGAALAEIIVLEVLILACTVHFFRADWRAGWLMVAYVLWVGFAAILNASFWLLNE